VALVAKQDAIVFHKAYGLADRANRIPNTLQTRFNIGSINKAFTKLAIDQLVARGSLSFTDTLGKFYPDYPQVLSRTATVQQLLSHTGGLADFFSPEFDKAAKDRFRSNADYFAFVGSLTPRFAPGASNEYCNGCYIALGAIVEKVSGVSYEQYVAQQIFAPAGMTSTGYPQGDGVEPALAIGYTRRMRDGGLRSNVYMHGATGSAAGGGYSTAMDLFGFVRAGRTGRLAGMTGGLGIAGGAPGTNAVLESNDVWTVVVLTNQDPPAGERLGTGIARALNK
jgi:CubicO group peptidase (beta-lactamase class C family)